MQFLYSELMEMSGRWVGRWWDEGVHVLFCISYHSETGDEWKMSWEIMRWRSICVVLYFFYSETRDEWEMSWEMKGYENIENDGEMKLFYCIFYTPSYWRWVGDELGDGEMKENMCFAFLFILRLEMSGDEWKMKGSENLENGEAIIVLLCYLWRPSGWDREGTGVRQVHRRAFCIFGDDTVERFTEGVE